ncbi:ribbon-helix-helix protein, CopG family [Methylobacterium brachiatum]|uniref:ribbon-helix-helix protein, CopG family n=1 Tax=Methylobacterium brachiatum TaxID=269660 RepID=UPI0008F1FFF6|nr:ribbon-helix-helix protein, CopG family [Methylobacterium brachiatum]SFI05334.1 Ribbon-helix-helix protein, copG family [Methylobacterium brachiatum]
MHRQPKGQKLVRTTIHLDAALLAALDAAGRAQNLTRSAMLAQLLRKVLRVQGVAA